MTMEDKKDNKVDTSRNGRPVSFSMGDGEDFSIDLPQSIPGLENLDVENMDNEEIEKLMGQIDENSKAIEDLLKSVGIDDLDNLDQLKNKN